MITIDWNSYSINQDADGTQVTELLTCSWQEYNQGHGLDRNGVRKPLPRIGTRYNYFTDPYLSVTNITVEPDKGKYNDITPFYLGDDQMVRMTITYSSNNASRTSIRADQAAAWDFKWNVELIEETLGGWHKYTIPNNPEFNPRITTTYKNWADEWRTANSESEVDDDDVPDLVRKVRRSQLIFTCYSSIHYGYRFSLYLGKINRTNWSRILVNKHKTAVIFNQNLYNSIADYNNDLEALDVDQYKWFFSDYEITELRPKVIKNILYFDFDPGMWDFHEGVETNIYQTAEFNDLTLGMERVEPPEEKNP